MTFIARIARAIPQGFHSGGWLMVAALPYAQVLGRGVFNVLGAFFLCWGLASLVIQRPKFDGRLVAAYGVLIVSFAASTLAADDPQVAFDRWRTFLLYSLVCFPVMAAIQTSTDLRRLIDAFALSGVLTIATLYGIYAFRVQQPGFVPEQHMREDNLPLLLPFVLCSLQHHCPWRYRNSLAVVVVGLATAYVILSNGRAALIGLLVGMCAYAILVSGLRKRVMLLVLAAIVASAFLLRGTYIYRDVNTDGDVSRFVNAASSYRIELWHNAIQHPPKNVWFGVGMGNIPDIVLTVQGATAPNLKHLHNFALDCWYENGLVGLAALLIWIGINLRNGIRHRHKAAVPVKLHFGTLLAASLAIIANSLLSYSYNSKQFAGYLFVFLVVFGMSGVANRTRQDTPPS